MTKTTKKYSCKISSLILFALLLFALILFVSCDKDNNLNDLATDALITSLPTNDSKETVFPESTNFESDEVPTENITYQPENDALPTAEAETTAVPTVTPESTPTIVPVETPTIPSTKVPVSTAAPTGSPLGDSDVLDSTTENNSEADIEAKKIIVNAESYNKDNKIFTRDEYFNNPSSFFLSKNDVQAYGLILDDLNQKTNFSSNQITKFYQNTGELFTNGGVSINSTLR